MNSGRALATLVAVLRAATVADRRREPWPDRGSVADPRRPWPTEVAPHH